MEKYIKDFSLTSNSKTDEKQIYICGNIRFSVLTPFLLRVEIQQNGIFCDKSTQTVINRNFDSPKYSVKKNDRILHIKTEKTEFFYDTESHVMEKVILSDGRCVSDYFKGNLSGTCRTLDRTNGKTKLNAGILSLNGVTLIDDGKSLLINNNGYIESRKNVETDIYYFAYGYEYKKAVNDFFKLTGYPPLIPRFALGNWWSRYKAYTQNEYIALMQKFIDKKIPLTVATIDMDWHWVDVVRRFGKAALDKKTRKNINGIFYNAFFPGWTGYSWNRELFYDPKFFLRSLKELGFKITMNLHPASGCKFYEDAYADFCEFMGIDKNTKRQINFDITDKKFIEGYFRYLHHPHEKDGVDFWWIDWQQGKKTAIKGLDPLWALNHYHSADISRNGKRPLILSRFAEAGSHRYPLGFSGDTTQSWASLDFQPYFTSTASNIGYTWWSHDIGGHFGGKSDDELYLRWVQFGVFSPIMRLHSTSNEFMRKEPWIHNKFVENSASDFMRLRHKMIPYIYSMNYLTAFKGRPLIEPMYYENPKDVRAYKCPNEYYFGSELIVCPITEPCDKKTGLAGTKVYLPKGRYTDIFSGKIYNGNTMTELFRDQSSIPVLAKAGAIIPMSKNSCNNSVENPAEMEILIFRGNNKFSLYEDDGETLDYKNGKFCITDFNIEEKGGDIVFGISPALGDASLVPEQREYSLIFDDISAFKECRVIVNDKAYNYEYTKATGKTIIRIKDISPTDSVKASLSGITARKNTDRQTLLTELISRYKADNFLKAGKYAPLLKGSKKVLLPKKLKKAIAELDELA